ncbi:conserved hypothetical protein [Histoplasma capsulatum H143]|uniref:Uncharacterized protein n=1 Tax=Ajellomyces capsulatus (strain H143) TaxID=544712 RepID=C6H5Y6_AJECH|nr:conserved hypothetical protein [Histoplasma capsulatum H143]
MIQACQHCPSSPLNGARSLRRSASVSSIRPHYDTDLSMDKHDITEYLATIERLEDLHYLEVARLQATLSSHGEELSSIRSRLENAKGKEQARKKSALERAQLRDAEIISLREELGYQKQQNIAVENLATEAEKTIANMQQQIHRLVYQLNSMRNKKEQFADRINRLGNTNTVLLKKNKAIAMETDEFKHEMNAANSSLMDAIVREKEKAGLALIQRDLERARCRQYEAGLFPINLLDLSRNLQRKSTVTGLGFPVSQTTVKDH